MKIARLTCDVCGTACAEPAQHELDGNIDTAPPEPYGEITVAAALAAASELIAVDPVTGTHARFRRVADEEGDA